VHNIWHFNRSDHIQSFFGALGELRPDALHDTIHNSQGWQQKVLLILNTCYSQTRSTLNCI